ncbi:MAG: hypothetical protein GX975_04865 [Clostridiales bacterium]|nr:hypothetical protein [Clostridiales bacterium]
MNSDLAISAAKSVGEILIMVVLGYGGYKLGFLNEESEAVLTNTMTKIFSPMMLLASYFTKYDPARARGFLFSLGLGLIMHLLAALIALIAIRSRDNPDFQVERLSVIYGNVGFMGLPLVYAIFGPEAVIYQSGIILVFNILIWSHGVMVMSGRMDAKGIRKALLSPNIICIILGIIVYIMRLDVPQIIASPVTIIGNCTTPVAMIVAGSLIARSNMVEILKNKRVYLVCALSLIVLPLALIPVLRLANAPEMVSLTTFTAAACPAAVLVSVFAIEHGRNASYASGIFAVSTLLSMATIPAMIYLYTII